MKKLITVRQALEDTAWLGGMLGGESLAVIRTPLIAVMGEPLTTDELAIFTELTGRPETPSEAAEELWIIAGRRSGKTRAIGTLAAYLAACVDYRSVLGPGERGTLPIMAASTLQAGQAYNFLKGIFTDNPRFAALVDGITGDTIALKNRIDIQIRPASFRTIRGITAIGAIAEECSWQSDDSRNPDKEILAAVRPSMATTGGTLFAIGCPHARRGEMWATFRKHYGAGGNPAILVANGPTKLFNPTIKQSVIDRAYEDDPQVAASEWGGVFRDDLESYVSPETVDPCTDRGVTQRPFKSGVYYVAHCDPSGGRQDSFTIAIGHVENGGGVVDVLLERRPPFSPESTVAKFCDVLKGYGVARIEGDRYGAEFTQDLFRKNGIEYVESECSTSDLFAGFLPILNSGRVSLLDHRRLASQLCALERRASRVGAKNIYFKLVKGAVRAPEIVAFLKNLKRHLAGRKLLIIWDRLQAHRSRLVRDYVETEGGGIKLEFLPPYAPELNPVEYLWAHWKQHEMPNFCPKDFAELSAFARAKLKRTQRRKTLVAAFWKQAELPF